MQIPLSQWFMQSHGKVRGFSNMGLLLCRGGWPSGESVNDGTCYQYCMILSLVNYDVIAVGTI